ncbi:MAG: hypothetical protein RLZZ226_303 [Pseudomonadota bacterium]|jgi:uncharacterized protein YaiE (UPF0345 family)
MSHDNTRFDNVSVIKQANVYGDRCVSHTVMCADGSRKTVGVIFPATLTFNTAAAEVMETLSGCCRYRLEGQDWQTVSAGQHFSIPAHSRFEIEVSDEPYHYVCHFEQQD